MASISCCGRSYTVDHAVKGADYIHGYDADNRLVVSFEGITDFSVVTYDGEYMSPEVCLEESCNIVKYVADELVKSDGTPIPVDDLIVTFTYADGKWSTDKTNAEIMAASNEGRGIFGMYGTRRFMLGHCNNSQAVFYCFHGGVIQVILEAANTVWQEVFYVSQKELTINGVTFDGQADVDMTEAVQTLIDAKIVYGTEEITDGAASTYPEGTLYVVIEGE